MSADPKSLATLAIASAKKNKARKKSSDGSAEADAGASDADPHEGHKFRSTDEFVAGWTAAFINTTALFPINKLIFRQMASGHGAQKAADQMKEEGLRYLYRGILPPLIQKMVSVSIMFGSFGHYKKWADNKFTNAPPITNLALAACLTGATEAVLTPLERVQMLLQDRRYHKDYKNTVDALIKLRQFGSAEYYRGLTCVLVRNGPSNILFFGLRDEIKKLMPNFRTNDKTNGLATTTASSSRLGSSSSTSLAAISDTNLGSKQDSTIIDNYYSSQHQSQPGGHFNSLKSGHNHLALRSKDSMLHDFLSGAILGMFISTLFYPLSVVRTRMQTRAPGTEFLSIVKAFNAVYSERDRKFTRLFHGCLINVMRQFISWGIINCSYEWVLDQLHNIK
uniref:Mitochondrial carrier triple repeat protein 1 n=1 Tax=Aceria tosichella TaxID=561515 RepID=A0A6G1SI51_9ACAR